MEEEDRLGQRQRQRQRLGLMLRLGLGLGPGLGLVLKTGHSLPPPPSPPKLHLAAADAATAFDKLPSGDCGPEARLWSPDPLLPVRAEAAGSLVTKLNMFYPKLLDFFFFWVEKKILADDKVV